MHLYFKLLYTCVTAMILNYCIAGYIGRTTVWRIARKRKKLQLNVVVTGSRGMIATPSLGGYEHTRAILVDLILAV